MRPRHLARRLCDRILRALPLKRLPYRYNGAWLWLDASRWETIYSRHEPYLAAALRAHLRPGGTMLDVGAHVGLWSLYAAALVGPRGRVVSLEPSAAGDVLAANASGYPQVTPLAMGAGDSDGSAVFFGQGQASSGSFVSDVTAINAHFNDAQVEPRTVPIVRLDTLVDQRGLNPAVVKIDVEGFEANVLRGARRLLQRGPTVIVEVHPPQLALCGGSEQEIMSLLAEAGYRVTVIDRNPNSLYTILATPAR